MKIAISGLNNTDNPAPGIPVAKSLKKEYNLIGLSYDANEPGNYQKIFDSIYIMPYPSSGFEELKSRLQHIKKDHDIGAIIPNLDSELPLYIKYQKEINKLGINLCIPSLESFELRNKSKLSELANRLNIKYPQTWEINSISDLQDILYKHSFPLMIKGAYYKSIEAFSLGGAIDAFIKISNEWGFPVLLQKHVYGEELNLVGVGDGQGELKGAVAIKKLTTTNIGKIWLGLTIRNEKLLKVAKDFVKQTLWNGPFELECMVNSDNDIHLIEINPRFPSWVYFATEIGVNLPKMVIDIMSGKQVKQNLDYPINKMYVRYVEELVTDFDNYKKLFLAKEINDCEKSI
ncbi:ATP-grasp domain-containing protein [Francisella salina]|uniref:ATP-grasp domain-containing protein n=1 Tax=Francisella salina TaxID=573569 RepID=A0ABM5M9I1_FRAST|nr:ATP-grasp domain-containing protein [Francisella salina]AEI35889.1 hypothetical protein F7308_0962 [Francisella salina]